MSVCVLCDCEFHLPKSQKNLSNLLFSIEDDTKTYMCIDCYERRVDSDFRYDYGSLICKNNNCGRDAVSFSDFCFVCDSNI